MMKKDNLSSILDKALNSVLETAGISRRGNAFNLAADAGSSLLGQTWLPVLDGSKWNLPTAMNMAAIAAMSYVKEPQTPGSPHLVLQALREGRQEPRLFGETEARMVLRQYPPHYAFGEPVQITRMGVTMTMCASPTQGLVFIHGTDSWTTALLDTAIFNVDGELSQTLRDALRAPNSIGSTLLEWGIDNLGLDLDYGYIMRNRNIILDYLEQPENQGAHLGFFLIVAAFLADGEFSRVFYAMNMQQKQLFIVGHSLGAALALLLSRSMQPYCDKPLLTFTFGCPKVGSAEFIRTIPGEIIHYRVVNNHDPVPLLPPGDSWKHHGKVRFIDHDDDIPVILFEDQDYVGLPGYHGIQRYCDELTALLLQEAGLENPDDYGWLTPKPIST